MIKQNDQLIDIYDIWYEPFWMHNWFYSFVALSIFVCIIVVFYLVCKKYIYKAEIVDCSVVAYEQLDTLENFQIVSKEDSKDCYFKVSLIIKTYLSCRYDKNFMKLTDKEIIKYAENYMSDVDIRFLHELLQSMTFIKFEYEIAMTEKLIKDVQLIRKFIENTTPGNGKKGI